MHFFTLIDIDGVPVSAPSSPPSFAVYKDRFNVARTPPVIRNLGGGCYAFDPSITDESVGVGYLINLGTDVGGRPFVPRYAFGVVGNAAVFFAAFDLAGAPNASVAPSISIYKKPDGSNVTPVPVVTNYGGGLYGFTPSDSDRVFGVGYLVNVTSVAFGVSTTVHGVVSDGVIVGAGLPGISSSNTGTIATTATPRARDLSFDFKTKKFKLSPVGDLSLVSDLEAIRQAVQIMCQTFLEEWFLDLDAGIPYFQNVLVKSPNIAAIRQIFKNKIESVPGVVAVTRLDLNFDRTTRSLKVDFAANTDLGEIAGNITPPTV